MHPLTELMNASEGFLLIGKSDEDRFPADSYNAYTHMGVRFFCYDMGGLTESRGKTTGGKVYNDLSQLPTEGRSDLALIWVKPHSAKAAVDVAHQAGCKRVWFSFQTGHRDAVAHARELGMEVVEIGRCPVYFMERPEMPTACRVHRRLTQLTGTAARPPQTDPDAKRRELF